VALQLTAFVAASAALLMVSRQSLRNVHSHGFWRFFAWECLVGLFVLNADAWFVDPFAPHQLLSWVLLVTCVVPVAWGTVLLRQHGRPADQRDGDPGLLAFEKTTELVTTGIYRYIRHPLYASLLLLGWGIFLKAPNVPGAVLAGATTLFLLLTATADEAECLRFFGPAYAAYMKTTQRFIPFVV
jgi:protein-S-isoprenylcysteine O-methyltransferase Ste14